MADAISHSLARRRPGRGYPRGFRMLRTRLLQAALLTGFWKLGSWVVTRAAVPIPGAVMGLFLVLALLGTGLLPVRALRHGAKWLMGDMLLFFIPPLLALLDYPQFFGILGLKLLLAIAAGTLLVMVATAVTVELCYGLDRASRARAALRARRLRVAQ